MNKELKEIEKLLNKIVSENVNIKDENGNTPLHVAVQQGNVKVVEVLLNKGANVNVKNSVGETPLDLAFQNRNIKIIVLLGDRVDK